MKIMMKTFKFVLFLATALALAACGPAAPVDAPAEPPVPEMQVTDTQPPSPTEAVVPDTGAAVPEVVEVEPVEADPAQPAAVEELSCTSPAALTPPAMEGPYYTPNSPERTSLLEDLPGTSLVLTGYVLDADCQPVPGAWVDFWQADSRGVYDNAGYTLRGHQFTDAEGRYTLKTVVPGQYPGRTEHLHVKVQAPGGPVLTTQLYFPAAEQNQSDRLFDQGLLVTVLSEESGEMTATFNFVVNRQ
jgi:predicted small lipoprotein YifL